MTQEKNPKKSPTPIPGVEAASPAVTRDVVLIHGVTDDKKGLRVLRARPEGIELGEVRPVQEGQPLNHDLVRLKPREGTPYICDVHTEFSMNDLPGRSGRGRAPDDSTVTTKALPEKAKGPAQVATQTYRDGWDAIWASGKKLSSDLN